MVMVDTSVWADFFNGFENPQTQSLRHLLSQGGDDVFYTGLILQKILQGIHQKSKRQSIRWDLENFVFIEPTLATHAEAAEIFTHCRS
jgi:predicted nucleic acid-binding protein